MTKKKIKGPVLDVTPEEARFVWESMRYPSGAKVSASFRSAGRHVSGRSIIQWRRNGWKRIGNSELDDEKTGSPLQKAVIDLETNVGILTGDPATRLADVVPFNTEFPRSTANDRVRLPTRVVDDRSLIELIDGMTDLQLSREVNRRAQGIAMAMFSEIDKQRTKLVGETPDALGNLFRSLSSFLEAANQGAKHFLDIQDRAMKVVNPDGQRGRGELEDDALDGEIEAAFSVEQPPSPAGDAVTP